MAKDHVIWWTLNSGAGALEEAGAPDKFVVNVCPASSQVECDVTRPQHVPPPACRPLPAVHPAVHPLPRPRFGRDLSRAG